jgi:hypothetical protein
MQNLKKERKIFEIKKWSGKNQKYSEGSGFIQSFYFLLQFDYLTFIVSNGSKELLISLNIWCMISQHKYDGSFYGERDGLSSQKGCQTRRS